MPYPRKVPRDPPPGCISAAEAMEILDMSRGTFYKYKRTFFDFPEPLFEGGKAWYKKAEIERWKRKHMPE